jgi:hypothetical protein
MKNNSTHSNEHAGQTPDQEPAAPAAQSKTPYLKAILSGTTKFFTPEKELPKIDPDRIAALRYIKESGILRNLFMGKMSC